MAMQGYSHTGPNPGIFPGVMDYGSRIKEFLFGNSQPHSLAGAIPSGVTEVAGKDGFGIPSSALMGQAPEGYPQMPQSALPVQQSASPYSLPEEVYAQKGAALSSPQGSREGVSPYDFVLPTGKAGGYKYIYRINHPEYGQFESNNPKILAGMEPYTVARKKIAMDKFNKEFGSLLAKQASSTDEMTGMPGQGVPLNIPRRNLQQFGLMPGFGGMRIANMDDYGFAERALAPMFKKIDTGGLGEEEKAVMKKNMIIEFLSQRGVDATQ